jgi:hypothetical protein
MWATALTYLAWRAQWRRERKLAAQQYAHEKQQEEAAQQGWRSFAARYGVKPPPAGAGASS